MRSLEERVNEIATHYGQVYEIVRLFREWGLEMVGKDDGFSYAGGPYGEIAGRNKLRKEIRGRIEKRVEEVMANDL